MNILIVLARGCAPLLLAAVLALTVRPGAANAILVQDLGVLDPGDSGLLFQYKPSGSFEDDYSFEVSQQAEIAAAALSLNFSNLVHISNFALSLFEGTPSSPSNLLASGSGSVVALNFGDLFPGEDYFLRAEGDSDGVFGGSYLGGYSLSAVPLPPALVLFLSALGILALGRYFRRS